LGKPEKVGLMISMPKKSEGGKVQANAYSCMQELNKLVADKEVSPVVIADNESIHRMFPDVPAKDFWSTANRNTIGYFDIFNLLANQQSQYVTFDKADYQSMLDSGIIIFGATKLDSYQRDTDIADGLRQNLKRTLLADLDIANASHVAAVLCAPDAILGVLPQSHIDRAFDTLERILNGESRKLIVHQGVYEAKRVGLFLYTMVGGLQLPYERMNLMAARAGI
jgi:cell division GTPase FtsZ